MKACPNCKALNPDDAQFCSQCGLLIGGAQPPAQAQYPPPPPGQPPYAQPGYPYAVAAPRYAGFWIRFAASIIDGIILSIAVLPLNLIFWAIDRNFYYWGTWDWQAGVNAGLAFLFTLIRVGIMWAYFVFMTGRYQATLGKMLVDVKVVGPDLGPISYTTAALREIVGKFVSGIACGLGYIWAGFDPRKQAWHDKIAKTFVIYSR
jgi:uncharacterized RDD family membrane protein YckC